jgi:ankyrin repeat protein
MDISDIFQAIKEGKRERVKELIANGADVNQEYMQEIFTTESYKTPLEEAAREGHVEIVQKLIAAGADVNHTKYWWNPLITATYHGHLAVVQILIAAGADVTCRNRQYADNPKPLHEAALKGHTGIIETLIAAGADVNARDRSDKTPLHYATSPYAKDDPEAARILIASGAKVNPRDDSGKTPWQYALENGHLQVVNLLTRIQERANVIGNAIATATHTRLGAESPLSLLPQPLLHAVTRLVAQTEAQDRQTAL